MDVEYRTEILTRSEADDIIVGWEREHYKNAFFNQEYIDINKIFAKYSPQTDVVVSTNGENYIFEYIVTYIKVGEHWLRPLKRSWRDKSYVFTLKSNTAIDAYRFSGREPNKVGKPTDKKLQDWLDYLLAEEEAKQEYLTTKLANKTKVIERLNELFGTDAVEWDLRQTSGKIVRNGVVLYIFFRGDGTATYSIDIDGSAFRNRDILWIFQQLSDNALKNI